MPLQKLTLKPGVNRENTRYTNEGGWYESEKVRFRQGTPEKIGGWQRISAFTFLGVCRSLWNWITLAGQNLLGVGTSEKFYIENGGAYYDITPIRAEVTLTNPFATDTTTNSGGQTTVTVTDSLGGFVSGDYVTFYPTVSSLASVVITGTAGQFSCTATTLVVGQAITITGILAGTGSITGYTSPTNYYIITTNGTTTFTLSATYGGTAITTTAGTPTGLTYTLIPTVGGVSIFGEYQITFLSSTTYSIRVTGTASSSTTGGGTVYAVYQVTTGSTTYTPAVGWGASSWGAGAWGIGSPVVISTTGLRIWNQMNWGQNLIYGPRNGPLYYWDATIGYASTAVTITNASPCVVTCTLGLADLTPITLATTGALPTGLLPGTTYYVRYVSSSSFNLSLTSTGALINTSSAGSGTQSISPRGVLLSSLAGSDGYAPSAQSTFTVSDASRFLIVFGTNDYGSTTIDPMLIRWSDQESLTTWYPAVTNQAGSVRLSHGSKIVTTLQSRQEIVVWTDSSLYSLQYLGPPYVWGTQLLADNISIIGPNAAAMASGISYWMGADKFYKYDGRVQTLNCDLLRYVYNDINSLQYDQVFASTNEGFNEVWFFYCSSSSNTIDRYVIYNYVENVWMYGTLGRTAWLDSGLRNYPIAATYSYNIVQHEYGVDNKETATTLAIEASVTSSQFDIGDGHNMAFAWRMLPDLTFNGSTAGTTPQLTMQLLPLQNSGSGYNDPKSVGNAAAQTAAFQAAATVALKMVVGTLPIDLYYDLNGDGTVNITDAVGFLSLSVGTPLTYTPNPLSIYTTITMGGEAQAYVTATQTYPIDLDTYTGQIYIRVRGRQMAIRITSNQIGTQWQLGSPRIDIRPDGRR